MFNYDLHAFLFPDILIYEISPRNNSVDAATENTFMGIQGVTASTSVTAS